jgi:signal transduction histidine kinase/PAS domain-containing protein
MVLLIATLIFINTARTIEHILISSIIVVIVGSMFYFSYKKDFIIYDNEINTEINSSMTFKSIVYNAPVAMLITDGENIEYHNKQIRILFKKSFRVIETSTFRELFDEKDADKIIEELNSSHKQDSMIVKIKTDTNIWENNVCIVNWQPIHYKKKAQYIISFSNISMLYKDMVEINTKFALYEELLDKLECSVSVFQQNGNLCFMNERCKNDIGPISCTNFKDVIEFDINKNLLDTGFKIALAGDTFIDEKISMIRAENEKWSNITITPIQTDEGITFVGYIVNDISVYKKQINELNVQLNIFLAEYRKTKGAILFWNKDGYLIEANDIFYKMFNINRGIKEQVEINIFSEDFHKFLDFEELMFINSESAESSTRFYGNTLHIGKKALFDALKNIREFEAYMRLNKQGLIKRDYFENNTESFDKNKEIWIKVNCHPLFANFTNELYAFVTNIYDVSEQFNLSKEFETTRTYLKSISNNFHAGIILIVDLASNIVFVGGNEQICENISKYRRSAFSNDNFKVSDVPVLASISDNVLAALAGHYSKLNTMISNFNYDFQFNPVRSNKNEVEYCLVFGFDVTDRDNYEKQLSFQRYLLDKTFAESQIPQVIIDANGLVNRANLQYYQLAGITPENIFDQSIYNKNNWLNKPEIITNFERSLNGDSAQFEIIEAKQFTLLDENDMEEYLYVLSCRSYPIIDSNNVVTNVIFNFIDVSDMRMLIEQMRKSTAINDIVIENYPSGLLIVLDAANKIMLFSGAEEIKLLGLQNIKILNNTFDKLEGTIFDVIKPYVEKVKATKTNSNFDFNLEIFPKNSFPMIVYYEANIIAIIDFDNNVESIFICLNNITNRKQLEKTILEFNNKLESEVVQRTAQLKETTYDLEVYVAELQATQEKLVKAQEELTYNLDRELELNKMKSQFISLMSHEFRTPLTIIQTTVYLLNTYYEMGLADRFEYGSKQILNSIELMTKLLDNILFLDEIKEQVANFTMMDVVSYIKEVIDEVVNLAMAKQEIVFKAENDRIVMYSDEKLIKQIISNLLLNAINYSPKTGKINITLLDSEFQFTFIIQDFGNGISDDVIDRIYETFVRSQDFTNISGSGLGLSITKNCVELLKGDIKFDTEKGFGTTFYVILPKLSQADLNIELNMDNELISDNGIISANSASTNSTFNLQDNNDTNDADRDELISDTGIIS